MVFIFQLFLCFTFISSSSSFLCFEMICLKAENAYWFRTSSGQQTGTENQLNWRKIWRNTENVNKFYSEQYKKWIEIIFNFGTGYYLVEVSNEVQNLKNVFKSSFSKIYYLGVRCLFGWMRRNPRFNHGYSGQILVYVLIVNCYPTWKKGQTDVKGINKEFNL